MRTFHIALSAAPGCENRVAVNESTTTTMLSIGQPSRTLVSQTTTSDSQQQVSVYNATPDSVSRNVPSSRKLRWTRSGQIVPLRFDVYYAKLGKLATLTKNWDGCDSPRPSPICVRHAKQALQVLADRNFEPNGIVPGGEGGIGITFRRVGKYADLEFFNDGEAMSALHLRDGQSEPVIEDIEVTSSGIENAVDKIIHFLCSSD